MLELIDSWLRASADRIHLEAPRLTSLDQAIGDGDHGTNMDRGFKAVVAALETRPAPDGAVTDQAATADLLRFVGRTLISTVGGASGPLYGTGFLRASAAVLQLPEPVTGGAAIIAALDGAATGIGTLGKATVGEKTMLDALVPAAAAARAAQDQGGSAAIIARAASDAAAAGAAATIPLLATKGRASYLGERSVGHQDPGATSLALLLAALADVIG